MRTRRRVRSSTRILLYLAPLLAIGWLAWTRRLDAAVASGLQATAILAVATVAYVWARRHLGRARSPGQAARRAVALRLVHAAALFVVIVVLVGPMMHIASPRAVSAMTWLLLVPAALAAWAGITALVERGVTRAFVVSSVGALVAIGATIPALQRSLAGRGDGWLAGAYITGVLLALVGFAVGVTRSSLRDA